MQKINKKGTFEKGYLPIYITPARYTNVLGNSTVNNMKNLHSFCSCNNLPSGRIAKLQGGYYILNDENKWEFLGDSLCRITFISLYESLSKLTHPSPIKKYGLEDFNRWKKENVQKFLKYLCYPHSRNTKICCGKKERLKTIPEP